MNEDANNQETPVLEPVRVLIDDFMRAIDRAKYAGVVALRTLDTQQLLDTRHRLSDATEAFERALRLIQKGAPYAEAKRPIHHPDCPVRKAERGRVWPIGNRISCDCGAEGRP